MVKFTTASSLLALLSSRTSSIFDGVHHGVATAFQLSPITSSFPISTTTKIGVLNAGLRDLTDPYFNINNDDNDAGGNNIIRGGRTTNSAVGPLSQTRRGGIGDDFDRLPPPPGSVRRGGDDILLPPPPPPPPLLLRDNSNNYDNYNNNLSIVERYYDAWNRRNIALALSYFSNNIYYDDTQFAKPFEGKDKLAEHLIYVADCIPDSFFYVIDELSVGQVQRGGPRRRNRRRGGGATTTTTPRFRNGRRIDSSRDYDRRNNDDGEDNNNGGRPSVSVSALWHVENEFGPLPYARGCSFFKIDPNTNLIVEGYEFPEPAVIKPGSTGLRTLSLASKLIEEPKRLLPFTAWVAYVYVVFFSKGILPGKDFIHTDPKTWIEVQNLGVNFMFIAPALKLPMAAKLHPMLEGVFNGLLAWSAMFWGFLSDDRTGFGTGYDRELSMTGRSARYYERLMQNQEQELDNGIVVIPPVSITKRNLIPFLPTVIGMQFLTSAFFLPYLFARTSERRYQSDYERFDRRRGPGALRIRPLYREELDKTQVLAEWKGLGVLLGSIGIFALWWGAGGRVEDAKDFGPPIWESGKRTTEFMKILANDRIAATIILDFWVFGFFQGWLVDDDWRRRGRSLDEESFLRNVAKFIPFFGLAAYLTFRPSYPSIKDGFDEQMYDERTGLLRRRGSRRNNFSRGRGGPPRF